MVLQKDKMSGDFVFSLDIEALDIADSQVRVWLSAGLEPLWGEQLH